jgi:cytochrome P450
MATTTTKDGICTLDVPKLLSQPLLQSIYSEELRMRAGVAIQRVPVIDNFSIGPWKFPRDQMIVASSWHEHRDTNIVYISSLFLLHCFPSTFQV